MVTGDDIFNVQANKSRNTRLQIRTRSLKWIIKYVPNLNETIDFLIILL